MWSLLWLWGAGRGWGWVPPTLAYLGCSFPKRRACLYTFVPNLSAPPVNGSCAATEGLAMPFHHPCPRCPPPPTLPQPLSLSDQTLHNPLSQCRLLPNLSGAGVAAGGIGDPPCTPPGTPQLCALLLTVMPALGSRVLVLGGRTWGRTLGTVRCPQSLAGLLRMSLGGVLAPSPHGAIGVPQGHRLAPCSRSLQPGHRLNLRSPSLGDQSWDQPLVSPWRGTGVHSCPGAGQSMAPDPGGTEKVLGLQWPELIALRNCLNCSPVLPKQPL